MRAVLIVMWAARGRARGNRADTGQREKNRQSLFFYQAPVRIGDADRTAAPGRSLATRERVVRATIDEMFAVGYHAATTQAIAERAQVSRGALLHHFPTRADLMRAALETLLDDGTAEIRSMSQDVRSGALPLAVFVEFLWPLFSGRFFQLSLN